MQSLDHLGAELDKSLALPSARAQIGVAIDSTVDLHRDDSDYNSVSARFAKRDLQAFLDHLQGAVRHVRSTTTMAIWAKPSRPLKKRKKR